MFDYHLHSTVSFDGYSSMTEYAVAAQAKGFSEICFTEHCEYGYPTEINAVPDLNIYNVELEKARATAPDLRIKAGLELGLLNGDMKKELSIVQMYPFDFIIASQHIIAGKDPYMGGFFEGRTVKEAQQLYLEELYNNIFRFDDFDVIGHIGYTDKYLQDGKPFEYQDFSGLIDAILLSAINRGKGIEVNTSNYKNGYLMPHISIIRRFAELGGEILTIGSDAHRAENIGQNFNEAYELLRECGIQYICTFEQRKVKFVRI